MTEPAHPSVAKPAGRPRTYRLVVPVEWWRVDLEPGAAERSVAALADRQFRGLDDAPIAKERVRAYLLERVDDARRAGGIELYFSLMSAGPVVVPASLLVSFIPPPNGRPASLEEIAEQLGGHPGVVEVGPAELPAGEAVRRRTRRRDRVDSPAPPEQPADEADEEAVPSFGVEYHLPVPEGGGALLVLTFSSPLKPAEDALVELFEAIAATVRWVW